MACNAVLNIGMFFKWVCSKVIVIDEIKYWEDEAAEILCQMEQYLPPSIFDIKFLPQEICLCSPVPPRWMYFVERYMVELKGVGVPTCMS
jgi:hypothetical protein